MKTNQQKRKIGQAVGIIGESIVVTGIVLLFLAFGLGFIS